MGKGSGTTRSGSKSNPKGLGGGKIGIWSLGTNSYGNPEVTASGKEAETLYNATQSMVEKAVESKVGDIRTGGGFSGNGGNREFSLIFKDGTTKSQIQSYLKEMKVGSKLYAEMNSIYRSNASYEEYLKAREAFKNWYDKTNKTK